MKNNLTKSFVTLAALFIVATSLQASIVSNGQETAQRLQARHDLVVDDCGPSIPAFVCSGVIIRGTGFTDAHDAWDPSTKSQESGGISFAYLRRDTEGHKTYRNSGFILYSDSHVPPDKIHVDVLCAFPLNASSDQRSDRGCGSHVSQPELSRPCSEQGIYSAHAWYEHFSSITESAVHQCGFSLRGVSASDATRNFREFAIARRTYFYQDPLNNELRLATWPTSIPELLPIEAFFYLYAPGDANGRTSAQAIQRSFFVKSNGLAVPVIRFEPPTAEHDGRFTYHEEDQTI